MSLSRSGAWQRDSGRRQLDAGAGQGSAQDRTGRPGRRPPSCSFPGSRCDCAASGRPGEGGGRRAGRRATRATQTGAHPQAAPGRADLRMVRKPGLTEGGPPGCPGISGRASVEQSSQSSTPPSLEDATGSGSAGWGRQLGEPWRGWGCFAGLQSRAGAIPGLPATCAHPAPARASRAGHPGWPERVLARTCSPQAPRPRNAGHRARLTAARPAALAEQG